MSIDRWMIGLMPAVGELVRCAVGWPARRSGRKAIAAHKLGRDVLPRAVDMEPVEAVEKRTAATANAL